MGFGASDEKKKWISKEEAAERFPGMEVLDPQGLELNRAGQPLISKLNQPLKRDTRFSSTNQPDRKKKPKKKLLSSAMKNGGYNAKDIKEIFSHILTMTPEQREKYLLFKKRDGLGELLIRTLEKAIKTGNFARFLPVIEYIIGKAEQSTKMTIEDNRQTLNLEALSDDEQDVFMRLWEKMGMR